MERRGSAPARRCGVGPGAAPAARGRRRDRAVRHRRTLHRRHLRAHLRPPLPRPGRRLGAAGLLEPLPAHRAPQLRRPVRRDPTCAGPAAQPVPARAGPPRAWKHRASPAGRGPGRHVHRQHPGTPQRQRRAVRAPRRVRPGAGPDHAGGQATGRPHRQREPRRDARMGRCPGPAGGSVDQHQPPPGHRNAHRPPRGPSGRGDQRRRRRRRHRRGPHRLTGGDPMSATTYHLDTTHHTHTHTPGEAMSSTAPDVHTATGATTGQSDDGPRRPWTVLALMLTAQILVVLDISVVNTALPTIGRSLHLASSDLQWMVTAYLLMSGGGLLLGGRIADLLPRHRVFMTGMFVFTAASLVSGFASSASEIVLARGTQGVGAALMTPAALSLFMTTYSGAQRTKALTLWGAVGGLGIAAGVVVGGALTTWAGWQSIFWVNVPIGVIALGVATKVLPRPSTTPARLARFDLAGAATAVGGLAALMFALAGAPSHGWFSARTITALVVS